MTEQKVYFRAYRKGNETLVVVCDQHTLGNVYKEGHLILNVTPRFYGGELVDITYAVSQIRKATSANLVGNKIVDAAVQAKLVHPDAIHHVQGVAHAQRIRV